MNHHLTPHIARLAVDDRVRNAAARRRHAPSQRRAPRIVRPPRPPVGS